MTVKDQDEYHPTEALILAHPRRHYRTTIGTVHWQLRSLISADGQNIVYFPTGAGNLQVQKLDIKTGETETIKVLPFLPRCLVAKNGWICSGGETGEFTAIDMNEGLVTDDADLTSVLDSAPDASQLLENTDILGSIRVRQSIRALIQANKSLVGKSKKFGKERVNCITLWFPPTLVKRYPGSYEQAAAVLANNDKSVTTVSLRDQEALDEVLYPDCVNRAVCSPDGRLLVAISDDPFLYVHERRPKFPKIDSSEYGPEISYRWELSNKIHLVSQSKDDRSDNRGSFAVCFSTSGRYLAVGTQYGAISVFDAITLADPDVISLVTSFTSSRPNTPLGAVRAMEFAPGAVDLLAWTEDRGRVGVADMRNGCVSRQIIDLDKEDSYDHIPLNDRAAIDPRLLDSTTDHNDGLASSLASALDLSSENRRARRPATYLDSATTAAAAMERLNPPLTPDETRVLEALQENSRRRMQRVAELAPSAANQRLGGDNRDRTLHVHDRNVRPSGAVETVTRVVPSHGNIVSAAVHDVLGSIREIRDQRDRLRETMVRQERQEREQQRVQRINSQDNDDDDDAFRAEIPSRTPRGFPPRREPPVTATTATSGSATTPATRSEAPAPNEDALSTRRALAARLIGDLPPSTSAWQDLETLWGLSFDSVAPYSVSTYENLRTAVDADARRRDRAAFLIREWEANPARRMGVHLRREGTADPYDTAGLAWSDDGMTLFVGAEKGIYEFRVNMLNRKFMPSNEFR